MSNIKKTDTPTAVHIETNPSPTASIIWLHGLGADGHDFADIVPALNLSEALKIRFIFPHAPVRPVTINANQHMRAWYDIYGLDQSAKQDKEGILGAEQLVSALISEELNQGILSQRIILAGFSQGGAVALYTALRFPKQLGGILALSTYLPLAESLQDEANPANNRTPIFMAHGTYDALLPYQFGKISSDILQQQGYSVEWHEYPMEHQICPEQIQDISHWLCQLLT